MTDRFWLFFFTSITACGMTGGLASIDNHASSSTLFGAGAVFGVGLCGLVLYAIVNHNPRP